jgi:hypothetical protein
MWECTWFMRDVKYHPPPPPPNTIPMQMGGPSYFSSWGGECWIFGGFPSSSQWVPWHVLNSSSLYPISFALSSILVTYVAQRRRLQHFYFGTDQSLVKKRFVMGQSKMPITNEKIELWVGSTIQLSPLYLFALVETGKDILKIWISYFLKNHYSWVALPPGA